MQHKNDRFTTQLQECENSVKQARIDSEDVMREFKTISLQSTKLFSNFSEQMETTRQKVTAFRLAHDETEHKLKRTQILFKNVSAPRGSSGQTVQSHAVRTSCIFCLDQW